MYASCLTITSTSMLHTLKAVLTVSQKKKEKKEKQSFIIQNTSLCKKICQSSKVTPRAFLIMIQEDVSLRSST